MPGAAWVRCGAMDQGSSADGFGVVTQVWRYPVKSMMGERLDSVSLGAEGVVGDRTWAVRDEVRGGIRGAKKLHGLMRFAARYTSEPPADTVIDAEITLPDGTTVSTGAADASEQVSKALDHPVTLWPLQPKDDLDHYRRGAPDTNDAMGELRALFALEPEDPLPDLSVFPRELREFESPPGTYVDAFPLLVMTEQSLASLQAALPASVVDVRRFRPSILLSAAGDGYPEQAWLGHRLRIGEATVEVGVGCPRCVMTTLGFADLPPDRGIMRGLVRETSQVLGVYASIVEPGLVRVGDAVTAA
jgi:uncharacterized protein YcbX